VRRYREGSWKPNKWLTREGNYTRAGILGVWIWEVRHVIEPLIDDYYAKMDA
jgi:hypothetical protein